MERTLRIALWLVAGFLLILHLHPRTRWAIQTQWRVVFLGDGERVAQQALGDFGSSDERRRFLPLASSSPDFRVAMAAGMLQTDDTLRRESLAALARRFPKEPAVCSANLRSWLDGKDSLYPHRSEDETLLDWQPIAPTGPSGMMGGRAWQPAPTPPPSSRAVARFLEEAKRGATLSPQNAYFPSLQALVLFAARRDAEALIALHDAAEKPFWDDYLPAQAQGQLDLLTQVYGKRPALADLFTGEVSSQPQRSGMRSLARLAIAWAVRLEQTGHTEAGFAIRRDVRRLSSRLRTDDGGAHLSLLEMALARPGGAPVKSFDERKRESPEHAYLAYLRRIGHPEEARALSSDREAEAAWRGRLETAARQKNERMLPRLAELGAAWAWSIAFLVSACLFLLLGTVASLLARTGRVRAGLPAHPGVRAALWIALVVAPLGAIAGSSGEFWQAWTPYTAFGISAVGVGIFVLVQLVRAMPKGRRWRGVGWTVVALAGFAGLLALGAPLFVGPIALWSLITGTFQGCGCGEPPDDEPPSPSPISEAFVTWNSFGIGATIWLPLLLVLALIVSSLIRRVPLTAGVVRGVARWSLPIFAALLLNHALAVARTVTMEEFTRREILNAFDR